MKLMVILAFISSIIFQKINSIDLGFLFTFMIILASGIILAKHKRKTQKIYGFILIGVFALLFVGWLLPVFK